MVLEQLRGVSNGAAVIGSDGTQIGSVDQVHEDYVLVKGGTFLKHDLYVPVSSVADVSAEIVKLDVPARDVNDLGWRFPPERGVVAPGRRTVSDDSAAEPTDLTTMTGAGYGTGTGPGAAGPLAPGRGDAIADRFGGSARAGLSDLDTGTSDLRRPEDDLAGDADMDDDAGDTGDDTSEGTSEDTSEGTSEDAPDQLV